MAMVHRNNKQELCCFFKALEDFCGPHNHHSLCEGLTLASSVIEHDLRSVVQHP